VSEALNELIGKASGDFAPANSDEALALLFAERHADGLRYVAAWGRWLWYDGTRWAFDDTRKVGGLARELCREIARGLPKQSKANSIASAKASRAVINLAAEDRRFAATVDQWDADPWLLNTPAGTIDLQTGQLREHRPTDYITKTTSVSRDHTGKAPNWDKFLARAMGDDLALRAFLARMCGYALTASTSEHALFFLYGTGANGKSVFISALTRMMGDYHRTAPMETFTASKNARHPTELAGLRGARLVTSVEAEDGDRWAEAKIKVLTGGDVISARFMRQDFFEFKPQFKLVIAGNHKPALRSVDEAIRRRLHLIPFSVTIPPEERDKDLGEKLKKELPAILAWAIDGCREWQKLGLTPPNVVSEATNEYLAEQDAIGRWIEDRCVVRPKSLSGIMLFFYRAF
jgi:putative DNA primase/helicase